jgi:hypothetical protein
MAYTTAEGRRQLLDALAVAIDELALALASVGEAYELLDDLNADRLEGALFRPLQAAYGRAKRTYSDFADRHGLPSRAFSMPSAGVASQGAKTLIENAVDASGAAGQAIASLQDTMLPVEVGDAELRAGLVDVRVLIDDLPGRARELVRTLGR